MERYDIIFKGEIMPGLSLTQVKSDLARLFKSRPEQLDPLFDEQPHALKSGLQRDEAERYHAALKHAGAITYLRRAGAQRATPASAPAGFSLAPMRGHLLREDERPEVESREIDTSGLGIAPLDSGPLEPAKPAPPPPPNTDHIQLI